MQIIASKPIVHFMWDCRCIFVKHVLKTGRREVQGSILGLACQPSRLEFSVVSPKLAQIRARIPQKDPHRGHSTYWPRFLVRQSALIPSPPHRHTIITFEDRNQTLFNVHLLSTSIVQKNYNPRDTIFSGLSDVKDRQPIGVIIASH